jgi:hypothetical protein
MYDSVRSSERDALYGIDFSANFYKYVRQAVLCAGDTTLDYADDQTVGPDGKVVRYGFTGANSTHQCRDWNAIKVFAEQHKSGERTGILV